MAARVTIDDATTNFSELLRRVEAGEEIVIVDGNKPIAVLSAFKSETVHASRHAGLGSLEGAITMQSDDVLIGPLSAAELDAAFGPAGALFT